MRWLRPLLLALLVYLSWLALMGVHEMGHVLHAWISGGKVQAVHFGLWEFSRTEMSVDPHPQFVAWGGPLWGSILPLALYGIAVAFHGPFRRFLCFWSGLCLIVNGGYIGLGWIDAVGDAGVLVRQGASSWIMSVVGAVAMLLGLYLWHRMGPRLGLHQPTEAAQRK